eukprot:TRINITY_DN13553_c0_g1_i1.p1 TRINITY_DN13553_c0_g1~~TRINITY_DN13553_c0_g1_i1.p1  ORF type:complete len:131 (+),score=18.01 TRINITY_DN13553_c0_g1_i1:22-393(+)
MEGQTRHSFARHEAPRFVRWMEEMFVGSKLIEEHGLNYHYEVPQDEVTLSQLFGQIQDNKLDLQIEDYSVSQPTLEQIFLSQTKRHDHILDRKQMMSAAHKSNSPGCCKRFWCCFCLHCRKKA